MVLMPLYGRLSDLIPKRTLILLGIGIFAIGAVRILTATDIAGLMVGQAIQGIGLAGMMPMAMALIVTVFRQNERGRVLGTWVSRALRHLGFGEATIAWFYHPYQLHYLELAGEQLTVYEIYDQQGVRGLDGDVPISQMRTMEDVVRASMTDPRLRTTLFAGFAFLAFVLSGAGVYGVTSYTVRQHTHEIGIRIALGASARRVLGETLVGGMRPVLAGMTSGLVVSFLATKALSGFLFEVEATDPVVYAAVGILLGGVALSAAYFPARRASHADPLDVLNVDG